MRQLVSLLALAALPSLALAQQSNTSQTPALDIRTLGDSVAGSGSAVTRVRRLVYWINDRFEWSATDYERRTPAEVIARRAGNCAELAGDRRPGTWWRDGRRPKPLRLSLLPLRVARRRKRTGDHVEESARRYGGRKKTTKKK